MGILFSYYLQPVCPGLILVDHLEDRAKMLAEKGVRVDLKGEVKTVRVKVTARPEEFGPVALMLLCVKAYSTGAAVKKSRSLIGKDTLVLTLQNGLGNLEAIMESVPKDQVLGGTTSMGANVIEEGFVKFAGAGETVIGQASPGPNRAEQVAEVFRKAGLEAKTTDNLEGTIWSKVLVNVGINALTALLRVRNGRLVEHQGSLRLMAAAVKEAESVVKARGIKILYPDALAKVEEVARKTGENISSMLQDVRAKRQTEIEAINGAIVKEAERLGLKAPVNGALTDLVRAVEESYGEQLN
jgi:2-dehydropantoate 2-reductase